MKEQYKKESPILSLVGIGGGGTGLALGGAIKLPTYVDDVFNTFLYSPSATQTQIQSGIDFSGKGGLVWKKSRSSATSNHLYDTERGNTKTIYSDLTNVEGTSNNDLLSFNSNGVTWDTGGHSGDYVNWSFRKQKGFFDVVTYTGDGQTGRWVNHNLGSVPGCVIIKCTSATYDWEVEHRSLAINEKLSLNTNSQVLSNNMSLRSTATQIPVSGSSSVPFSKNKSGETYVAYVFAHDDQSFGTDSDESIIKCGSWTASGGAASINLGFEPQFVITKISSGAGAWFMFDSMRGMVVAGNDAYLRPDSSGDENSGSNFIDPTSTGFNIQNLGTAQDFIYIAIRRPNKPPEAAINVFAIDTQGGTSPTPPGFNSTFPVDFVITKNAGSNSGVELSSRLTQGKALRSDTTVAEQNESNFKFDYSYGFKDITGTSATTLAWMFKRAPGFMDVVTYTGTGSATTINHNLGAVPSVVLIKGRNTTYSWYWQHYALGANTWLQLNNQEAGAGNGGVFNSTLPTSSVFSVGSLAGSNGSGNTYIAYLFADLPGISKAGTFTGTGNDINVDCGFTSGARFVLIKRTDGSGNVGDWYVWDTTRGIASGNDPYIVLNDSAAQVTNTDYIDPLNAGFTVTSSAPAALNASGGTYIFLAIA